MKKVWESPRVSNLTVKETMEPVCPNFNKVGVNTYSVNKPTRECCNCENYLTCKSDDKLVSTIITGCSA